MNENIEPVIDIIKGVSKDITQTMTEASREGYKATSSLNEKKLELMNNRDVIVSYQVSPLIILVKFENRSCFKPVRVPVFNQVGDLMINKTILVTLSDNLLNFYDSSKKFKLKKDLLKMITNYHFNFDNSNVIHRIGN